MYQSNQARIKKEIPSLLPGRGQGPRPVSSLPRVNSTRGGGCYAAAGAAREREGRPGALPMAEQERRDFLLNSCLIRLIHLSLYREVYLTPKQGLLDS